jgi:V8-like Glu-specific endopeptidase
MSWDPKATLDKLKAAADLFDEETAVRLSDDLVDGLQHGEDIDGDTARKVLAVLRRKAWFPSMERVAEALYFTGHDEAQIRRQYAQALIDQGKIPAAVYVIESLIARTADDPAENAEARGLLGRIYKQLYVNAVNAGGSPGLALNRLNLQRAVDAYLAVYRDDPREHLWHGINAVALAARAQRDAVPLPNGPDPAAVAGGILTTLAERGANGPLNAWDLATGAEAHLALGDATNALLWIARYVQEKEADAFEIASTLRQLTEVWGLTLDKPPGLILLPLLQSQLLDRKGGHIVVTPGKLAEVREKTAEAMPALEQAIAAAPPAKAFEKVLGKEGVVTMGWYKLGLDRAQVVAKVLNPAGDGFGTGFLIRAADLVPPLGDEILLLTNAHVVSSDPAVRAQYGSLDPDDATIIFEAFEAVAGQQFKVKKLLWTSAPDQLDASLLRIDPPISSLQAYSLAKNLPVVDGVQKVYVIGHPGGRTLSISLNDNLLLDYDDRLVHYRAPTEGGSSGSPVFNQSWQLIGLHHAGGTIMNRLNGKEGTYAANEGIWIQRLIKALGEAGIGK